MCYSITITEHTLQRLDITNIVQHSFFNLIRAEGDDLLDLTLVLCSSTDSQVKSQEQ